MQICEPCLIEKTATRAHQNQCDENRPCGHCQSRSLTCEYVANKGETRAEALKRRVQALEQENDALNRENRVLKERNDELVLLQRYMTDVT